MILIDTRLKIKNMKDFNLASPSECSGDGRINDIPITNKKVKALFEVNFYS